MSFKHWDIPRNVLEETYAAFTTGRHEVFVIWTAPLELSGSVCKIQRCVVPIQQPGVTLWGVYVHIEGNELSRIQFENYDHGERSVIQLHTHPSSNVLMSELDKKWEVVKHIGALSIIVPYFGDKGLIRFPGVNVYERERQEWRLWSRKEISHRLRVLNE